MAINAIFYTIEFNNFLAGKDYDAIIIRGDRYEMLGLAMCAVYKGFKIIHIEGGDESGVVDNKVRHAISQLADWHFCTNEEALKKLIGMGVSPSKVWNYGSLDVEFADRVEPKKERNKNYILVAYHGIEGEDPDELDKALTKFKKYDIIKIGGNSDYNKKYGSEEFPPDMYINLLRNASCLVGNSSSLIKEASITGVGVVLIGDRQHKRLMPRNVVQVPCKEENIKQAINFQLKSKYERDNIYFKPNTSKEICNQIKKQLSQE